MCFTFLFLMRILTSIKTHFFVYFILWNFFTISSWLLSLPLSLFASLFSPLSPPFLLFLTCPPLPYSLSSFSLSPLSFCLFSPLSLSPTLSSSFLYHLFLFLYLLFLFNFHFFSYFVLFYFVFLTLPSPLPHFPYSFCFSALSFALS